MGMKKGAMVLFHSRFRNYRISFGSVPVGKDPKGNTITGAVFATFSNFALALEDNEKNAPLIALLREHVGTDYVEVDFKKKKEEEDTKDSRIKKLEEELKELRLQGAPPAKPLKVRASKPTAS